MSSWQAVVVEGQERTLRAFVAGFTGDRGVDPASVMLGDDVGLEVGSIGEWLLELVGQGHHVVLAPEALGAALADAIAQTGKEVGLRVERVHGICHVLKCADHRASILRRGLFERGLGRSVSVK